VRRDPVPVLMTVVLALLVLGCLTAVLVMLIEGQ
jgi:hypothetical protein